MIVGDANLCEVATFLKVGTTAIVLAMIEDDVAAGDDWPLGAPGAGDRQVVLRPRPARPLDARRRPPRHRASRSSGSCSSGARKYERAPVSPCVGEDVGADVLARWEHVLTGLEADPMSLADQLDWVAKHRLLDGYASATAWTGTTPGWGPRPAVPRPAPRASRCSPVPACDRLTTDDEVARAVTEPPTTTRAYFRGRASQQWADDIVAANWDSLVFDVGRDPLRRVPMMEPTARNRGARG